MAFIADADRQALRQRFEERLRDEVTLKLFTQSAARSLLTVPGRPDCLYCEQTQGLMQELVELSPRLRLEVYDFYGQGAEEARRLSVERIPALVLGDGTDGRVKFYGIPLGYEFSTIIEGIEALAQGTPVLKPNVAEAAREAIHQPVHLQVFVTPT